MALVQKGNIEELLYARLDPGDDLLLAIKKICKDHEVRTGLLLDATGALEKAVLQRFPRSDLRPERYKNRTGPDYIEVPGPLELSARGIIGEARSAHPDAKPAAGLSWADGDPYFHIHMVVTNADMTVCGHLMEGTRIAHLGKNPISHFTVVIAKVKGVLLQGVFGLEYGHHHELLPA